MGGSVTAGVGFSGGVSYSQGNMNSDWASVTEQSGIHTGSGGYQLDVAGNTHLTGAVIASNSDAIANGRNSLSTETLQVDDIQNHGNISGSSMGLGANFGVSSGDKGAGTSQDSSWARMQEFRDGQNVTTPTYAWANEKDSSTTSTARGTNVQGKTIDIEATDGDLSATGAKIQGQDVSLAASGDINLRAATNTEALHNSNSGSSYGAGVTIGLGQQSGFSIQLSAAQSKGRANGSETTYDNTLVQASNSVKIKSGGDTTLDGAQLEGRTVNADIGGNLNITTRQDTSTYEAQQTSSGFQVSLCIPPICNGQTVSGGVSVAKSDINHNYRSAQGQSGIFAGESYDVTVKGNTDLKGGAITTAGDPNDRQLH